MINPYKNYYTDTYKELSVFNEHKIYIQNIRKKLHQIRYIPSNRILDIACGISTFGKAFGKHVYGIDINAEAIKIAKRNGIKAKIGNVEKKWAYPDESFDVIIASHIIEHMINPDHIFNQSKRLLKKNGILIIATPNLGAWFNRILLFVGIQPFFTEVSTLDKTLGLKFTRKLTSSRSALGHLRLYTLGALKDIIEFHGFAISQVHAHEFPSFPTPIRFIDKIFSLFPSLASNVIVVCQKKQIIN